MQKESIKNVYAIKPYTEPGRPVFKVYPYESWKKIGGNTMTPLFPPRLLHGLVYRWQLPPVQYLSHLFKTEGNDRAMLMFVQPVSLNFDTFPYHSTHEIIPFMWDCWPIYFEYTCNWFEKNKIRTAIFTSSMTANLMKVRFPQMNILALPEGIDTSKYAAGNLLSERKFDVMFYGRPIDKVVRYKLPLSLNVLQFGGVKNGKLIHGQSDLFDALADSKVVIALPQSMTAPEQAGNIETLTQRYWENMLSRQVIVGHAPKELIDLIGYNPVIEIDLNNPNEQIVDIIDNIDSYQALVDKNRRAALEFGDWDNRMALVRDWLNKINYLC